MGSLTKKRIFIVLSILLLVVVSLPVTAYFVLKSPGAQAKILKSLKDPFAKQGVMIESTSMSVDLLAGVNFENLVISVNRQPLIRANLTIDHMRFSYSIWALLSKRIVVQEATIKGFKGTVVASLPPSEPVKEEPSLTLAQMLAMLRTPPVDVSIPAISMSDTDIKLTLVQGPSRTDVDLRQADIQISGTVNSAGIDFELATDIGVGLAMQSDGVAGDAKNEGRVAPSKISVGSLQVKNLLKLHVDAPKGELNWRLSVQTEPLKIKDVAIQMGDGASDQMQFALESLTISPETIHLERTGVISDLDPMSALIGGLKGEVAHKILLNHLAFESSQWASGSHLKAAIGKLQTETDLSFLLAKDNNMFKHDWALSQSLQVQGVQIETLTQSPAVKGKAPSPKAKPVTISLANATVALNSKANQGPGTLALNVNLNQINTDLIATPLTLEESTKLDFNLLEQMWSGRAEIKLNKEKVLSWTGSGKDQKDVLTHQSTIDISVPKTLSSIHKGLEGLAAAGWPKIEVDIRNSIQHPQPWSQFKGENWPSLGVDTGVTAKITPTTRIFPAGSPEFAGVTAKVKLAMPARPSGNENSELHSTIDLAILDLKHEAFVRDVTALISTAANVKISKKISGNVKVAAAINQVKVLSLDTTWTDAEKTLGIESQLLASVTPDFMSLLTAAKTAPPLGVIQLKGLHRVDVHHGAANILSIKKFDPNNTRIEAKFTETIEQNAAGIEGLKVKLERPFVLSTEVTLVDGQVKLVANAAAPKIVLPDAAIINDFGVDIKAFVSDLTVMKSIEFSVQGAAQKIEALIKYRNGENKDKIIKGFKFGTSGQVKNKNKIIIENIFAGLQDELVKFSGSGEFSTEGRGQLDANLSSKLSSTTQFISGSGQFDMPMKFLLLNKDSFSVEAVPTFKDYSLVVGDLNLKNLNGTVNISEDLKKDAESKIRFKYLRAQSPFARIDFENLSPFLGEKVQLGFDSLTWKHIVIGPLIASFEVQQNLIVLNDLKMDLLGGSALGRFFLDLDPKTPRVGFLGRFSGIIPELLKAPEQRLPKEEWGTMAGRSALIFEIRKRLATGRIDLTTLGKRQLMSLLDVVDPTGKDEQIAMARQALRVAYPKFLNVEFDQGMMDFTVGLGGVVSQDIKIRSLPLSNLINSNAGEALSKVESFLN